MRDRHWSMPFLNPPSFLEERINICCKKFKVDIFKGNRMSHLLSKNSNKGKAINVLKNPISIGLNIKLQNFIATKEAPQTAPRNTKSE